MAFNKESEKLVGKLIMAEYLNASGQYGDKYNSLHEAFAVLLEEVEEVEEEFERLKRDIKSDNLYCLWEMIKSNDYDILDRVKLLLEETKDTMQELAQVGAVLLKWENTLEVKE